MTIHLVQENLVLSIYHFNQMNQHVSHSMVLYMKSLCDRNNTVQAGAHWTLANAHAGPFVFHCFKVLENSNKLVVEVFDAVIDAASNHSG